MTTATAAQISNRIKRTALDWSKPIDVLALLPAIRDCDIDIEPPPDHKLVLRIGNEYFQRFHSVHSGPATTPNRTKGMRLENLIIAASFAVFVVGDSPRLRDKIFVELLKNETGNGKVKKNVFGPR